jgi:hypothetical protein
VVRPHRPRNRPPPHPPNPPRHSRHHCHRANGTPVTSLSDSAIWQIEKGVRQTSGSRNHMLGTPKMSVGLVKSASYPNAGYPRH